MIALVRLGRRLSLPSKLRSDIVPGAGSTTASAVRNACPDSVYVVCGSSRGIGLEFTRQILEKSEVTSLLYVADPQASTGLCDLKASNRGRLHALKLDLEKQSSVDSVPEALQRLGLNRVDLLLNVAGILHDEARGNGPERSLAAVEREWMVRSFEVNCVGPTMMLRALLPMLHEAAANAPCGDEAAGHTPLLPVVASLSARVGSISDNNLGGWLSYRTSKAALNMVNRTAALELKRGSRKVISLNIHPGTVDTDLSKPFQRGVAPEKLFTKEGAVRDMLAVIEAASLDDSGGTYDFAGKKIEF